MNKFMKRVGVIVLIIVIMVMFASCGASDAACDVSYYYTNAATGDIVTDIYVGDSYYLNINYLIEGDSASKWSFSTSVNANDNMLITYCDGTIKDFAVNGNIIQVSYDGSEKDITAIYKLDIKSAGSTYLKFINQDHIKIDIDSIELVAKE